MAKKSGGSAPEAPDPKETAAAEAYYNRVDTFSPNGSGVRYGYTAPDGTFTTDPYAGATPTKSTPGYYVNSDGSRSATPQGGDIGDAILLSMFGGLGDNFRERNAGRMGATYVPGTSGSGGGGGSTSLRQAVQYVESPTEKAIREMLEPASVDFTSKFIDQNVTNLPDPARVQDRGDIADTIYNRTYSLLSPQIEKGTNQLIGNLQARGMPVGGEGWNDAYGEHVAQTNDTLSRLAMDADIAAGQEQSRLFGLDAAQRSTAMSELMAVMGGNYQPGQTIPSGNVSPINYSGMVQQNYSNELAQYQQQQKQSMATAGALGSLGSALIKSSMAYKKQLGGVDTTHAAKVVERIPITAWTYLPEHAPEGDEAPHVGPMAEHFHMLTGLGRPDVINVIDYLGVTISALQNALQRISVLEREKQGVRVN